jgi:hypothetical protein
MILRMESSLTRTSKTKERLCCDTTDNDEMQMKPVGTRAILVAVVRVNKEAQEGVLGIKPNNMCPGWSASINPTVAVGRFRRRRELRCRKI